jgi:Ala-tRNA(Pro) deacylase
MNAERVRAAFQEHGVEYEVHDHPRAITAQEMAAAEHLPGWQIAKPVFVWAGGKLVMLVLPAPFEVDLEQAAAALDSETVRLATEDEFTGWFDDCEDGAEVPFGNLYDMQVYVDDRLLEEPRITFAFGRHDQSATVSLDDYVKIAAPIRVHVGAPVS